MSISFNIGAALAKSAAEETKQKSTDAGSTSDSGLTAIPAGDIPPASTDKLPSGITDNGPPALGKTPADMGSGMPKPTLKPMKNVPSLNDLTTL